MVKSDPPDRPRFRARAVGNAVYLERAGGCGDIAVWGMPSAESAQFASRQVEGLLAYLQTEHELAEGALREALDKLPGWAGANDEAHEWWVKTRRLLGDPE